MKKKFVKPQIRIWIINNHILLTGSDQDDGNTVQVGNTEEQY